MDLGEENNSQWPIVNSQDENLHAQLSQFTHRLLAISYRLFPTGHWQGYPPFGISCLLQISRAATRLKCQPPWLTQDPQEISIQKQAGQKLECE
jgi:hypothetical protein